MVSSLHIFSSKQTAAKVAIGFIETVFLSLVCLSWKKYSETSTL